MGKNHDRLRNNLQQIRKSRGLTQQQLSESADVSRKSINAVENGIYIPSTVLALKIARTLECSVEDLFELPWFMVVSKRIANAFVQHGKLQQACYPKDREHRQHKSEGEHHAILERPHLARHCLALAGKI